MVFIYHAAPGCNFEPTKYTTRLQKHIDRKKWCPCKDAKWTVEKAREGQEDGRACRLTNETRVTTLRAKTTLTSPRKEPPLLPKLVNAVDDSYVDISIHLRSRNKSMRHFLKSKAWLAGVRYVSKYFNVPAGNLIREEHGHVYVHPMLMAGVVRHCKGAEGKDMIPITRRKEKEGFVYLVTSPVCNAIKIGSWRSCIKSLRTRYITPYGLDLVITAGRSTDCGATEKEMHKRFASHRINCELFAKEFHQEYIAVLKELTNM